MSPKASFLFAMLIGAVPLAGCVTPAYAFSFEDERSALSGAYQEAADWSDAAILVGVVGIEVSDMVMMEDDHEDGSLMAHMVPEEDPRPGDGRLPAWGFVFRSPEYPATTKVIVVDDDGRHLYSEDWDEDGHMEIMAELADWRIDAVDAAARAQDHSAAWERLLDNEGVIMSYQLGQDEEMDDPHWLMVLMSAPADDDAEDGYDYEAGAIMLAMVNAQNGTTEVVDLMEFMTPIEPEIEIFDLPTEKGEFDGTVTILGDTAQHSLSIAYEGHDQLFVEINAAPFTMASPLEITVTSPDGSEDSIMMGESIGSSGTSILVLDEPLPGSYAIDVKMVDGIRQGYEIDWCAPGNQIEIDFGSSAPLGLWGSDDPCAGYASDATSGDAANPTAMPAYTARVLDIVPMSTS